MAAGETFLALRQGLQNALWALGGVPEVARSDSTSIVERIVRAPEQANRAESTPGAFEFITAYAVSAATGAPSISGTVQVDQTLTADTSGIADADGLANASFTYQWSRDGTDIADATGSTYTLVDADEGKVVTVAVSFTDDAGNDESVTSAATAEVAARPNSPAAGQPTITGTVQVGETLTADISGIADTDGLSNASFTYQWLADNAGHIRGNGLGLHSGGLR